MARFQSILGFIDVVFNEIFVIINTLNKSLNVWPLVKKWFLASITLHVWSNHKFIKSKNGKAYKVESITGRRRQNVLISA